MRSSASVSMVGKMEAMQTPSRILPIHKAVAESRQSSRMPRLRKQPIKSAIKIRRGRMRVEIGIPSKRPRVKNPQKAEVRYAAVISFSSPNLVAYV